MSHWVVLSLVIASIALMILLTSRFKCSIFLSMFLKTALGSSTVAVMTAASIVAPMLGACIWRATRGGCCHPIGCVTVH